MPRIQALDEIEIHVPAEIVFNVVSDYENINSWLPIYSCKYLNGATLHEGLKVYHQYGKPPFVLSRFTRVIDKFIPNDTLEESYIDGDLRGSGKWLFKKTDNGTRVSYECDVTSQAWFGHITFTLFGKNAHSNVYKPLLQKLKAHCETLHTN